ncbi:GNAT family N-acetyltransferase [Shouchella patagoniensis]|uniref:GNAT family N-acetyltransferase n=1 Tax=Shouchella patagoniensis TaxID=228576 RepID=UPI0009950F61|nr:GNAT family N-acetyltransferase [Shouchella patagoniensis]
MRFVAMSEDQAKWIAYQWKYEGAYSFFHDAQGKDVQSFLEVGKKGTRQFAIYEEDHIIGFLGAKKKPDLTIEIAPGMKPELKGKGRGKEFVQTCVSFLKDEMKAERIIISIASENKRAIHVFEEAGFVFSSNNDTGDDDIKLVFTT